MQLIIKVIPCYAYFFDFTTTEGTIDAFLPDGVVDGRDFVLFEGFAWGEVGPDNTWFAFIGAPYIIGGAIA